MKRCAPVYNQSHWLGGIHMLLGSRFFISALVLAATASVCVAQEFKNITDAAYCSGAVRRNIDLIKKTFGNDWDVRADEQNLARLLAIVEGAFSQRKIDIQTANKLVAVGHADA